MESFFAFQECSACAQKTDESPILCESCINNSGAIMRLHTSLQLSGARHEDVKTIMVPMSILGGIVCGHLLPFAIVKYFGGLLILAVLFWSVKISLKLRNGNK